MTSLSLTDEARGVEGTPPLLKPWRCERCNKLLIEYHAAGYVLLRDRCDRCGTWNELEVCAQAA